MTILLEAVYHRPKLNWAYAYDERTIHLRIRTQRNNVVAVSVLTGDKYAWERTARLQTMTKLAGDGLFDYWEAAVQPPFKRLRYAFLLENRSSAIWLAEDGFRTGKPRDAGGLFEYAYLHATDLYRPPAWVKDAVFYQIFPERFANGDPALNPPQTEPWGGKPEFHNYFGGDLPGVLQHLDYISELGVNALYFTPVFAATTNHKYNTRDYMQIDPHFGTNAMLKQLVDACHARGIRVLLDAVFNHCGSAFPPFIDAWRNGPASAYAGWFHVRDWPLRVEHGVPSYETFAFEPIMPKLNTAHPDVQRYLLGAAEYWVREIGIDGWRFDVADEIDHRFLRLLRDRIKALKPDAYLLGEVWQDALMWLQGDQFDGVMNYPLARAVLDFVNDVAPNSSHSHSGDRADSAGFAQTVGGLLARYPRQAHESALNLLDSHDTSRLLTICKGDKRKLKLAALLQFAFPGAPCIYYGDEIGMSGSADPDCRRCMVWEAEQQDRQLFDFYRRLIALRKRSNALRSGELRFIHAKPDDRRLALERVHGNERLIIIINADQRPASLTLTLSEGKWHDALDNQRASRQAGRHLLYMPAYGYVVLATEGYPRHPTEPAGEPR